jgi:OOP family OmpA-OmpF porin
MELHMKKKLLCCALLAGVGMANSAMAQTYDDRWYVGGGIGVVGFDRDRDAADEVYGMMGLGKQVTRHFSLDAELFHTNASLNAPASFDTNGMGNIVVVERNWELLSLSLVGRYHFNLEEGRKWHPYVSFGLGAQEHHDGTLRHPIALGFNPSRTGTDVVASVGLGAQFDLGYPYLRTEIGARWDTDDNGASGDHFTDGYMGFEFIFPIGAEAVAPPPAEPPPPAKTCADLDDDGDGVNNCDDKCPGSTAGTPVGADGCPVPAPEPEPLPPKPYRN